MFQAAYRFSVHFNQQSYGRLEVGAAHRDEVDETNRVDIKRDYYCVNGFINAAPVGGATSKRIADLAPVNLTKTAIVQFPGAATAIFSTCMMFCGFFAPDIETVHGVHNSTKKLDLDAFGDGRKFSLLRAEPIDHNFTL